MVVGDLTRRVKIVIVGGGTGGYVAAIRAAQLGMEVALIEKDLLGGVCLNYGCIPSKALIHAADMKKKLAEIDKIGILVDSVRIDPSRLMNWKDQVVSKLRNGIISLLKENKIEVLQGEAKFISENQIYVSSDKSLQHLEFEQAIIATGSTPMELPGFSPDGNLIFDSTGVLSFQEIPHRLFIIGAGSIGLELGTAYAKLGSEVTIVDKGKKLLSFLDDDVSGAIEKSLKYHQIKLYLAAKIAEIKKDKNLCKIRFSTDENTYETDAERVLVAVGRTPNSKNLALEKVGVQIDENGFIKVDDQMRTSNKDIFAIGDVIKGPMLAHKAAYQGKIAAEVIAGKKASFQEVEVPNVMFTDPEIASIGLTENVAKSRGIPIKVGKFPFRALGRTFTLGLDGRGFSKIVAEKETGTVLGVHIVGPSAADLIAEGVLAVSTRANIEDVILTIHAHPTLAEGVEEAAEHVFRRAIHILNV